MIGYEDSNPWKGGVAWPDPIAGLHAAGGILTAIWNREADFEHGGVTIENAQIEATIAVIGDRLMEAQITGDPSSPGNREQAYLAQGVYPCNGDDRWIAVSVVDDNAWHALQRLTGFDPDLIQDHDHFDAAMTSWTADHDQHDLMLVLQQAGVSAAAVHDAAGVMADPHFQARNTFTELQQPESRDLCNPDHSGRTLADPRRHPSASAKAWSAQSGGLADRPRCR